MANQDRFDRVVTRQQPPAREPTGRDVNIMSHQGNAGRDTRHRPARPDPETGEVPAGPGDAGLQDRPVLNAGSPGTRQMSNGRLGIGLGIAALLAILVFLFAAIF